MKDHNKQFLSVIPITISRKITFLFLLKWANKKQTVIKKVNKHYV